MKLLDILTDRGAMFAAIIVSLGITILGFVVITPDILPFRIVMGTMGSILVLFSPRALAKRKFGLWRWIAALIIFFEVSTVLTMTATQSLDSVATKIDPVQTSLHQATVDAQNNLTEIINQQKTANNRATLDNLDGQFKLLTEMYNQASARESAYRPEGQVSQGGIDPNKLFMAIPTAVMSGSLARWMTLVFSLIVAVIFQAVILATVTATVKQIKKEAKPVKMKRKARVKKVVSPAPSIGDFKPEETPVNEVGGMTEVL